MQQQKQAQNKRAFTLIELMVVIGIILFLAKLAIPRLMHYYSKARHAEVAVNLSAAYTAQQSYQIEHGTFSANLKATGWQPNGHTDDSKTTGHYYTYGCKVKGAAENEQYFIGSSQTPASTLGTGHADNKSFLIRATAKTDEKLDRWKIDETGNITHETG